MKIIKVRLLVFSAIILTSIIACESLEPGEPLLPADEVKPGPGLFSGESGEIKITTGNDQPANENLESYQEDEDLDLQQTSALLDEKIKQLEQQKKELEILKRKVDKKIQN